MSETSITSLIALMDAYRGEIWQHHTTRSDLYNAAMAELNALLVEIERLDRAAPTPSAQEEGK